MDWLKEQTQQKYPVTQNYPFDVREAKEMEFTPAGYEGVKKDTFDQPKTGTPESLLGEYLHLLKHRDPYYQYMAKQFDNAMTPKRWLHEKQKWAPSEPGRTFKQDWDESLREAYPRAYSFPDIFTKTTEGMDESENWRKAITSLAPHQQDILKAIDQFLKQQMYSREGSTG